MHPTPTACGWADESGALLFDFLSSARICFVSLIALWLGLALRWARADDMRGMEKCGEKLDLGFWIVLAIDEGIANICLGMVIHDNASQGNFLPPYRTHVYSMQSRVN